MKLKTAQKIAGSSGSRTAISAFFAAVGIAAVALGASVSLGACVDDSEDGITPVTGIVLRSDALFSNVGCGTGDSQVYRYVGVVADPSNGNAPVPNAIGVYACFADGNFDLPSPDASNYVLRVYAFDEASYNRTGGDARLLATAGDDSALRALAPTYVTSCTASEQLNIEVLAVCAPLVAYSADAGAITDAAADARASEDAASDGGDASDLDGSNDGADGSDAGNAADAADASDASATDSGVHDAGADAADASDAADGAG